MLTREQAVRGRHSPALWGLLAACAGELILVAGWNAWDRREQLLDWAANRVKI